MLLEIRSCIVINLTISLRHVIHSSEVVMMTNKLLEFDMENTKNNQSKIEATQWLDQDTLTSTKSITVQDKKGNLSIAALQLIGIFDKV